MLEKVRVEVNCLHRPGTQKPFQFVLEPNVWWEVVLNISLQVIWGNFRPTLIAIRNSMRYFRNLNAGKCHYNLKHHRLVVGRCGLPGEVEAFTRSLLLG